MPLVREFLEETPEAVATQRPLQAAQPRSIKAHQQSEMAAEVARSAEVAGSDEPPAPLKGLGELPHLDFWEGEKMPVKNTFIDFASVATPARAGTSQLSGDTEPKDFAPLPFNFEEHERVENPIVMTVKNTFIDFATAPTAARAATSQLSGDTEPKNFAPEPFNVEEEAVRVENPTVISLQNSLVSSMPQTGKETRRIQLNLSVWIPANASRASAASEPPVPVRLSEHHFPVPKGAHSASQPGGDPVCRRLFPCRSI